MSGNLKVILISSSIALIAWGAVADKVDYNRDVLPILSAKCFECHGPDGGHRKANLRLDLREGALARRDTRPAIVPGQPQASELISRLTATDPDDRMPPAKKGPPLPADQIQMFRRWIAEGAPYAEHWAFVPPQRPPLPKVHDTKWVQTPIDRFALSRLEQEKLRPPEKSSREILIRRATLDLIGLPPTPEEIDAFVADRSPNAYEKLVDRLLASPHYGERWGRHWLDVARYADSGGFETDIFFAHAWRYRDYVIRSFNDDKPFDRFIKEQIAGDELYPEDKEALIATSLYTTGPVLEESAMVKGKLEYDLLTDETDTTGSAFLGLTVGCARCHDHKYDPISQKDYYALQAIFADSDQFDFKADGTKMSGQAAVKNTLSEFELEQAKARAQQERDPALHDAALRLVGDYYIKKDPEAAARIELSRRYVALQKVLADYQQAMADAGIKMGAPRDKKGSRSAEAKLAIELAVADNGVGNNPDQADDDEEKTPSTETFYAPSGDKQDDLLYEIGQRMLDLGSKRTRTEYAKLLTQSEKRRFLIAYGRENLALQKPTNLVEDVDAFRLDLGKQHWTEGSQIPIRVLAHRDKPLTTRILNHGDLDDWGDIVKPAIPASFRRGTTMAGQPPEQWRSTLANWIASPDNPLTARVIVNRLWQWHFGEGLVRTANDFGVRGDRPTHPELLDWLAVEFVEHGWSIKYLNRLIMLSSAYQISPNANAKTVARDPDDRWLTRFQPHRLEAEEIWDCFRAVAGTLNLEMYGLPIAPPLDDQEQIGNFRKWPTSTPEESNRRAVYLLVKRSFRFPMLSAFDLPDNAVSCGRRDITTVPNQALALLNNRTIREQAAAFAARLLRETHGDLTAVPDRAWRYTYGRHITPEEAREAAGFLKARSEAATTKSGDKNKAAVEELCLALFNTNEFVYEQ
jgi:Protein of unknown function (DUF1549)/Protein of unknown function (DUF1553)/Planctomycete cytochrome C